MRKLLTITIFTIVSTLIAIGCSASKLKDDSKDKKVTIKNIEKQKQEIKIVQKEPTAIATINKKTNIAQAKTYQLIKLDATNSYDPDGNNKRLTYIWTNNQKNIISNKKNFVQRYNKKGLYEVTLEVTDEQQLSSKDKVYILVDLDKKSALALAKQKGIDLHL